MNINWRKDYNNEFICPKCGAIGLHLMTAKKSIVFKCSNCLKTTYDLCNIKNHKPYIDLETNTTWLHGQKMDGFICHKCGVQNIIFYCIQRGKKKFLCQNCQKTTQDSIEISSRNLSRYGHRKIAIKPFEFENDIWDLRAIICTTDEQNYQYLINFKYLNLLWFKILVKQYIIHLCKLGTAPTTINSHFISFRFFTSYLLDKNISSIQQINRSLILDFISEQSTSEAVRKRLCTLKDFFTVGNLQKWFEVDQDIIRNDDYPKARLKNPDPLSEIVRQQIENKLYLLPDFIARMWIIGFFTAMRPSELALLQKDCLIQEGANWKIIWNRKKSKDQHEVPITRTIAKVVQEQQSYINNLWGQDWEYLFCHYQDISKTDLTQPKIKPVKKVISKNKSPLKVAINCLIKAENICDENGKLATFRSSLLRTTRLTQLFEQGHDLAIVSAWAGHKQLATTSLHYTKVSCELIAKEAGHIQKALFNADGIPLYYESMPKTFWENPRAHELDLPGDHINTPIYGYCGLNLDQTCDKFRACYTCSCFVATPEKIPLYIKTRDELRAKESRAAFNGHDVLVEQFGRQADQLDKIIAALDGENHE